MLDVPHLGASMVHQIKFSWHLETVVNVFFCQPQNQSIKLFVKCPP